MGIYINTIIYIIIAENKKNQTITGYHTGWCYKLTIISVISVKFVVNEVLTCGVPLHIQYYFYSV